MVKQGLGGRMTGKSGEHLVLSCSSRNKLLMMKQMKLFWFSRGWRKSFIFRRWKRWIGNVHFKTQEIKDPYFQPGLPGQLRKIRLELKLIADVGLVGYPNVGKSTLISVTSNASPEIANYEFTTLTPKLGVVEVGNYNSLLWLIFQELLMVQVKDEV